MSTNDANRIHVLRLLTLAATRLACNSQEAWEEAEGNIAEAQLMLGALLGPRWGRVTNADPWKGNVPFAVNLPTKEGTWTWRCDCCASRGAGYGYATQAEAGRAYLEHRKVCDGLLIPRPGRLPSEETKP